MHLVLYYRTRNTGLTQPYSSSSMSCRILPMLYKPCPLPGLESFQSTNAKDVVSGSARLYWWIHACDPCWNKLIVQWCKYYRPRDSIRALVLHVFFSDVIFASICSLQWLHLHAIVRKSGSSWRILFFAAEMRRSTRVMVR